MHKISLVACARWEASCIAEWLAYHRHIGFDHVYLYCNDDDPAALYEAVLPFLLGPAPFVTFHFYPYLGQQKAIYLHWLRHHKTETEWFAILDIDEFLRLPRHGTISALLDDLGRDADAIYFNWATFGNNGHDARPPGSVLLNYTRREATCRHPMTKMVTRADVINPDQLPLGPMTDFWHYWNGAENVNSLRLRNVLGEDMRHYYDEPAKMWEYLGRTGIYEAMLETAIVNHYFLKSRSDFLRRTRRGTAGSFRQQEVFVKHYRTGQMDRLLVVVNAVEDRFLADLWAGVLSGGVHPLP